MAFLSDEHLHVPLNLDRHDAALRSTCADFEASLVAARQAFANGAGSAKARRAAYEPCELGHFGLADPVRFELSGSHLSTFAAYDQMVRQGAEPDLAAALADHWLWQSPWALSDADLARLPTVDVRGRQGAGIAMRVTRSGMTVGVDDAALHTSEIDAAIAAIAPHLAATRASDLGAQLILVADHDVPGQQLAALAEAALVAGADEVGAMATDTYGNIEFVDVAADPQVTMPEPGALGIEGLRVVWQSQEPQASSEVLALHSTARLTVDTRPSARLVVNATCSNAPYEGLTTEAREVIPAGALPRAGGTVAIDQRLFIRVGYYGSGIGCRVTTLLVDPGLTPAVRDRVDVCFDRDASEPGACPPRAVIGPHAWSVDIEKDGSRWDLGVTAGRTPAPDHLVVLTSCPQSGLPVVESQIVEHEFVALDAGEWVRLSAHIQPDTGLREHVCRGAVVGVSPGQRTIPLARVCLRNGEMTPGECVSPPPPARTIRQPAQPPATFDFSVFLPSRDASSAFVIGKLTLWAPAPESASLELVMRCGRRITRHPIEGGSTQAIAFARAGEIVQVHAHIDHQPTRQRCRAKVLLRAEARTECPPRGWSARR
ncbi:MAG: hypothetical protein IPN32_16190 [Deltaproteobacteria bacterium]|nr:hypothetical protein [Deltaproteobacteria bacterium]